MIKYVLTFFMLTAVTSVIAQKKSVINLIKSESVEGVRINGEDVLKVYKGTFQQEYSTLQSDSAYVHQKENTFDAFGHVVITQGDTMHIYSDKLNYNDNTKVAVLTDNVKMVDKDATLTTNFLTYNTATRYGTYTNGGKLVNKDNTLTSQNGYYFAKSRDSYFRYNVRLLTPDALILTDTMRYNTGNKIAYFYGPTNIYGKKKGKDNDTLYTENGRYDTNTEQAFFGKKNLYHQDTKSLTGDSLFYDRKKGFGRAIDHIIFKDTKEKMTLKGDIGNYYKSEERTVVTKNAYGVLVTEEKDTTKKDSLGHQKINIDSGKKEKTDTAKADTSQKTASAKVSAPATNAKSAKSNNKVKQQPVVPANTVKVVAKTDTASSKKPKNKDLKLDKIPIDTSIHKKDTARIKHDSIYMTADTLETRVMTYKEFKDMQEKLRLSRIKDTTARPPSIVYKKPLKYIEMAPLILPADTSFRHNDFFGAPKPKEAVVEKADKNSGKKITANKNEPGKNTVDKTPAGKADKNAPATNKLSRQDSIKKAIQSDSAYLVRKVELSDTAHVRILSAFHHVKMFKSDLQGKSDSAFYSSSDSTIRLFINPLVWTQGSQLSGDTINIQMKDKKLNNMEIYPNAFVVNVEKGDSTHFNQAAGKKMRGFFHNDKLDNMYISGNAETIYFSRDSSKTSKNSNKISGMQRSLSSKIHMTFKDGKVTTMVFAAKPEHRYGPLSKFNEDEKVLKGFIWKPKERPVSKESIIPSLNKNAVPDKNNKGKPPAKTKPSGKNSSKKKSDGIKASKDTTTAKPGNGALPAVKSAKDSTQKQAPNSPDTSKKGKDTSAAKKPGAKTE